MRSDKLKELEQVFPDMLSSEWVSEDRYVPREDARRYENFESNRAGVLGIGKAAAYLNELGVERVWERVQALAKLLRASLGSIPGIRMADQGQIRGGLCTFILPGHEPEDLQAHLKKKNIHVSITRRGGSLIDMEKRGFQQLVRASVHYFNTEEEIKQLAHEVIQFIELDQKGNNH